MILFVCTGNTCRSPLAAALARAYGVDAQSAGLSAYPGDPASSQAARVARLYGADLSGHRARQVTREMVDQADAIFVMTPGHRAALCALFPQAIIDILPTRGLDSFYAERHGLIVGF